MSSKGSSLGEFTARLRRFMDISLSTRDAQPRAEHHPMGQPCSDPALTFEQLALDLFGLQFQHNLPYRRFCESRNIAPVGVEHWTQIPFVPATAFKEFELTCLRPDQRVGVFYSSGTTAERRSRHFHSAESLAVYEESLLRWFGAHLQQRAPMSTDLQDFSNGRSSAPGFRFISLTPSPAEAPHSSLGKMFGSIRRRFGSDDSLFAGQVAADGAWELQPGTTCEVLVGSARTGRPVLLLGTAFLFVHLLDLLCDKGIAVGLPRGSMVLETGGYKGRARSLSKSELHSLITDRLGVAANHIICEYGMSELSSQAYEHVSEGHGAEGRGSRVEGQKGRDARFQFPPWARARIVSPESGQQVREGETGLLQVLDLANVYSVLAIQTEDLAVRRGTGFELLGRAALAEPRGCSLMAR